MSFHGEKRSNETHASTTDPEARLARKKGKESKMSYSAHALMENRNGLMSTFESRKPTVTPSDALPSRCSTRTRSRTAESRWAATPATTRPISSTTVAPSTLVEAAHYDDAMAARKRAEKVANAGPGLEACGKNPAVNGVFKDAF